VNVIYGFGFMDLAQEPIILSAPDSRGRYYMIEICDMWANAFAYVGGLETGYRGGAFAPVGPGWEGDVPAGVTHRLSDALDRASAARACQERRGSRRGARRTERPSPHFSNHDFDLS
jgi:hypothetical protein